MIHSPLPPNFDEVYLAEIDNQIEGITAHLLAGRCRDFPEYKAMTGQVSGLKATKEYFQALVSKLQKD